MHRACYARPVSQNLYTSVASSMVMHTQIVTGRLAKVPVGGSKRVLQISELTGPSSNGGELARQSLMLSGGGEQPVCGWVDFAAAVAEVRDYPTMKAGYETRFRKTFDVLEPEYRGFLQKLLLVFKELGVRCEVTGDEVASAVTEPAVARSSSLPAGPSRSKQQSSLWPVLLAGVLALAGIVTAVFLLTR